jgi:hypothetical protein
MNTVVAGYYGADLAVINIGDIFTTGPEEAAFAVRELIRPASADTVAHERGRNARRNSRRRFEDRTIHNPADALLESQGSR